MDVTDARLWRSDGGDGGSVHALGNGRLCVYGQGPHLMQIFGPPYSCPMLGRIEFAPEGAAATRSRRAPGTAVWSHDILADGCEIGRMTDFVDADLPCMVRRIRSSAPLRFHFTTNQPIEMVDNSGRLPGEAGGWLCELPAGRTFYSTYPFPSPVFYQLAWMGPVQATRGPDGGEIICGPGESLLLIVGGPAYPQAVSHAEAALAVPYEELAARTARRWAAFAGGRRDLRSDLPADLPQRELLLRLADDVAVSIKAQQSEEGGVLAGHNYHLCYVRDQYGTSRGLLALGHHREARAILEFYWRIWQRHGAIHNAQAAGVDGAFHVHENDEAEITGYLIRQAFDLLAHTGDRDFTAQIQPMLEWAWEAQKRHLVRGMMPFNGDETYVAGGILPRDTLNDGSAEATLLFIDSGDKLLHWLAEEGGGPAKALEEDRRLLASAARLFRRNFFRDGRLLTNNPERAREASPPRFRHGVCERCAAEHRLKGIGWTERDAHGRYLCPACLAKGPYTEVEPRSYALQSVSLTPFYLQSDLFAPRELAPLVEEIARRYRETGKLPSRPDDDRDIAVGYDYGFLLYALTGLGHPLAGEIYGKMLSLADDTGAWVEYYLEHRPMGTRCRPWESAINLEAALRYALLRRGEADRIAEK